MNAKVLPTTKTRATITRCAFLRSGRHAQGACAGRGQQVVGRSRFFAGAPSRDKQTLTHATSNNSSVRALFVDEAVSSPEETSSSSNERTETSYSKQWDEIMLASEPLQMHRQVKKPCRNAQKMEKNSRRVWLSDVFTTVKRNYFLKRSFNVRDKTVLALVGFMHLGLLAAPMTFTWGNFGLMMAGYFLTGCIGITFGYHRMIAHKSFTVPKVVEYFAAYCGALSIQGDPLQWASTHRYHHLHTDTPKDPHSTYEGAWWSHAGWFMDNELTGNRTRDHSNAKELAAQPFYRYMEKTYSWHLLLSLALLYAFGGFGALIWGGCVRTCLVWHITWSVNSLCHIYGKQEYNTKDLSRNNWLMGVLAWGEGWHNNHHAFEYSARHGLKWWQVDVTWMIVRGLELVGLAKKVKLPSEAAKAKLAFD